MKRPFSSSSRRPPGTSDTQDEAKTRAPSVDELSVTRTQSKSSLSLLLL